MFVCLWLKAIWLVIFSKKAVLMLAMTPRPIMVKSSMVLLYPKPCSMAQLSLGTGFFMFHRRSIQA